MSTMLNRLGLKYKLFIGYDWRNLDRKQITSTQKANLKRRGNPPLTPGEIACAQGHLAIYHHIVKHNYHYSLILEDDVILIPEFISILI